jgi:hypothetical protein
MASALVWQLVVDAQFSLLVALRVALVSPHKFHYAAC